MDDLEDLGVEDVVSVKTPDKVKVRVVVDVVLVDDGGSGKLLLETGNVSGVSEIVLATRKEGDGKVDLSEIVARGVVVSIVVLVAKVAKVHVAPVVLVGSLLEVDHVLDARSGGVKTGKHIPAGLVPVVGVASHQSAHGVVADLIRDITGDFSDVVDEGSAGEELLEAKETDDTSDIELGKVDEELCTTQSRQGQ